MLRNTLLIVLCLVSQLVYSQTQASDFEELFEVWKASENLASASYGFVAKEVETGKLIFAKNADLSLIPASTQKVTTTLTAMAVLGKDFRFETHLKYNGTIDTAGILCGNLYLEGGGDPSLGYPNETEVFEAWCAALEEKGIKKIVGNIIGDARFFDPQINPGTWTWEDLGNYYGAGVSGLNFHRNQYEIYFKSGAEGTQTTYLYTKPELPEMTLVNELKAGGRGDNAFIYGSPYTNFRYIRGTITPNRSAFRVRGSLPDPCAYAASGFKRFLEEKGIAVSGKATTYRMLKLENKDSPSDRNKQTVLTLKSEPLTDLVEETNRRSLNLYAETFLKMIGRKLNNGDAEREKAAASLRSWWEEKGVSMDGFFMEDGSGLSRYSVLTTRQQVEMLVWADKNGYYDALKKSFPVAGESGSIRSFGRGTKVAGNLHAKSGYLRRVKGYTGYVKTRSGKLLAFSMLANHFGGSNATMNQQFEKLMILLAELP